MGGGGKSNGISYGLVDLNCLAENFNAFRFLHKCMYAGLHCLQYCFIMSIYINTQIIQSYCCVVCLVFDWRIISVNTTSPTNNFHYCFTVLYSGCPQYVPLWLSSWTCCVTPYSSHCAPASPSLSSSSPPSLSSSSPPSLSSSSPQSLSSSSPPSLSTSSSS